MVTKDAGREAEKEEALGSLETHLTRRMHRSRKLRGPVTLTLGRHAMSSWALQSQSEHCASTRSRRDGPTPRA